MKFVHPGHPRHHRKLELPAKIDPKDAHFTISLGSGERERQAKKDRKGRSFTRSFNLISARKIVQKCHDLMIFSLNELRS